MGHFGHPLGHGAGLEKHENPRLSKKDRTFLEPGMDVTVKPSAYLPSFGGLRIEDLVVVTENGHDALSLTSKESYVV